MSQKNERESWETKKTKEKMAQEEENDGGKYEASEN